MADYGFAAYASGKTASGLQFYVVADAIVKPTLTTRVVALLPGHYV
jgi:hypothetical protein